MRTSKVLLVDEVIVMASEREVKVDQRKPRRP
jgi:hypothetical protein